MTHLYIANPGHLDIRAITTMGISAKATDSAIGYFGTGLKYAIAVTLRLGGSVRMWNHDTLWVFRTKDINVRDKDFQIIEMVGITGKDTNVVHQLPITTDVGKNWQPWQALREFLCNAMDEGGGVVSSLECRPNTVFFDIEAERYDEHIANGFENIFVQEGRVLFENDSVIITNRQSRYGYYKGVRVVDLGRPAALTYNFKQGFVLTEDRTTEIHSFAHRARHVAVSCDSSEVHDVVIEPTETWFEDYWFDHDSAATYHPDLLAEVIERNKKGQKIFKKLYEALLRDIIQAGTGPIIELTTMQQKMLDNAVAFLEKAGYPMTIPIKYTPPLGKNVMGQMLEGTCFLSKIPFDMGMRQLIATLMEEQLHYQYELLDCTYSMQNKLFELLVGEIATRMEEVL